MSQKIQIRLNSDGSIEAETLGIKGKSCLDFIKILEKMMDAKATDSDYKPDFYDSDNRLEQHDNQVIKT